MFTSKVGTYSSSSLKLIGRKICEIKKENELIKDLIVLTYEGRKWISFSLFYEKVYKIDNDTEQNLQFKDVNRHDLDFEKMNSLRLRMTSVKSNMTVSSGSFSYNVVVSKPIFKQIDDCEKLKRLFRLKDGERRAYRTFDYWLVDLEAARDFIESECDHFFRMIVFLDYAEQKSRQHVRNTMTPEIKNHVAASQKWSCKVCRSILPSSFEIDHIRPVNEGGNNSLLNLQALCAQCHSNKTKIERLEEKFSVVGQKEEEQKQPTKKRKQETTESSSSTTTKRKKISSSKGNSLITSYFQ
jgi:5-methylcytosine-specific restriction endonuclease McrA